MNHNPLFDLKDTVEASAVINDYLLRLAERNKPLNFQAYFFGGIVANVIGNMSDEYYEKFRAAKPCGIIECNCHEMMTIIQPALDTIRADHQKLAPKPSNN